MAETSAAGGLSAMARRIGARLLQFGATRCELFALECGEELRALLVPLGLLAGAAVGGLFSLALVTVALLLALPADARPWGAGAAAVIYGAVAAWLFARARRFFRERPAPFAATVEELKRDRAWIDTLK